MGQCLGPAEDREKELDENEDIANDTKPEEQNADSGQAEENKPLTDDAKVESQETETESDEVLYFGYGRYASHSATTHHVACDENDENLFIFDDMN